MKKLFIYPALVLTLGACYNNKAEKEAEIEMATSAAIDTLGNLQERARLEDSLNSVADATVSEAPSSPAPTRKPTKKTTPTSEKEPTAGTPAGTVAPAPSPTPVVADEGGNTETAKTEDPATPEPEEKKKKGINNTVKGAIIGAGAGAVGGAIINKKNPGKGAIIGGVVGAGAGAVTGVILDKNKKKKEAKDTASTKTTTKEPDANKSGDDKP